MPKVELRCASYARDALRHWEGLFASPIRPRPAGDRLIEIDERIRSLDAIASRSPKLLRWRRVGVEVLALIHERYCIETGLSVLPASFVVSALEELDKTRQGRSPLLLPHGKVTSAANQHSDRHHSWIKANAIAAGLVLVVFCNNRHGQAAKAVAQQLRRARYRPRKGSQSIKADTVARWISGAVRQHDLSSDASAAFVDILLKYFDKGKFMETNLPADSQLRDNVLQELGQVVQVLRLPPE